MYWVYSLCSSPALLSSFTHCIVSFLGRWCFCTRRQQYKTKIAQVNGDFANSVFVFIFTSFFVIFIRLLLHTHSRSLFWQNYIKMEERKSEKHWKCKYDEKQMLIADNMWKGRHTFPLFLLLCFPRCSSRLAIMLLLSGYAFGFHHFICSCPLQNAQIAMFREAPRTQRNEMLYMLHWTADNTVS